MKTSQNFHNYNKNFLAMLIRGEGIKEFEKYEFSPLETLFEGKSKKTIKINNPIKKAIPTKRSNFDLSNTYTTYYNQYIKQCQCSQEYGYDVV